MKLLCQNNENAPLSITYKAEWFAPIFFSLYLSGVTPTVYSEFFFDYYIF